MWTSAELKLRAKGAFYKNFWHCVLVALIIGFFTETATYDFSKQIYYDQSSNYVMGGLFNLAKEMFYSASELQIVGGLFGFVFLFVKVFLGNPLVVGGCRFFVMNQTVNPTVAELGFGLKSQGYTNVVLTMFLKNLYTSLWTLLFVIPGVIKHYEYLMIPYILAENPQMDRSEAFLISKKMMMGQKINVFALDLSFIGWRILSALTLGILNVFYVQPYYEATIAELYSVNRTRAYQEGYIR